jgi:hypothetical protein
VANLGSENHEPYRLHHSGAEGRWRLRTHQAYDLIAQGKLEKVKIGRKTIITARSVDRLLEAVAA